jgi:outer membrane immunogenic protein
MGGGAVKTHIIAAGLAALGLIASGTSALAQQKAPAKAPAYVAPAWSWNGVYLGVNVGWDWGEPTGDRGAFFPGGIGLAVADGRVPGTLDVRPDGAIGGGQIGVNWQTGPVIFGLEADIQASGIREERNFTVAGPGFPALPAQITAEERIRWFGTARARLGVTPVERALLYVTGGFAYGSVDSNVRIAFPFPGGGFDGDFSGGRSGTKTGWTAGGGFEYAWDNNWSVKAEYLYIDLGSDTVRLIDPNIPDDFVDYRFRHRDHIVRAGINYKFGAPAAVIAKY